MPVLRRGCAIALVPALFLVGVGITAQNREVSDLGRVALASVLDSGGRAILDLDADEFVVTEGGSERDILDVHIADYPLVILIDGTGADAQVMQAIKTGVARFVTRIGDRPVALGTLSNATSLVTSLEVTREALLERVASLSVPTSDAATALSAVANAARILQEAGALFSGIVVVTSRPVDASQLVRGELLPLILRSGTAVHVIESDSRRTSEAPQESSDLLRVLSEQTRGRYTKIFSLQSYRIALDRLADQLATEFMVTFLVPQERPTGDVRIGVRRAGARVLGLGAAR